MYQRQRNVPVHSGTAPLIPRIEKGVGTQYPGAFPLFDLQSGLLVALPVYSLRFRFFSIHCRIRVKSIFSSPLKMRSGTGAVIS